MSSQPHNHWFGFVEFRFGQNWIEFLAKKTKIAMKNLKHTQEKQKQQKKKKKENGGSAV